MSHCQPLPPAVSADDEDALQMAPPELMQRMVRGRGESQVGLEAESDEEAAVITMDDGSVWKPYWQRQQRPDEAIRASGEHPPDLKRRVGSPRPLSIGDDIMARTLEVLDMSHPPTEASEKADPASQVGDFQHDVVRSDKPPEASRDDTLSEGLPAVDGATAPARIVHNQKGREAFESETATESTGDARRANVADVLLMQSETVQEVDLLQNDTPNTVKEGETLSRKRSEGIDGHDPITQEHSEEQILRRRPISVTSTGDSKDSQTSKQNVLERSPSAYSTKSSRSKFGDLEVSVLRALRPVRIGATQTEEMLTSDASTQTSSARVEYQKMAAGCVSVVFIVIYLYLCYVLTLYTKHFYETDIKEDLDFL